METNSLWIQLWR